MLIWPATWRVRKLERKDSEDKESVVDKEKPMKKEKQGFVNKQTVELLVTTYTCMACLLM